MNYKIKIKSIIYLFNKNHYMFYLIKKKKSSHEVLYFYFRNRETYWWIFGIGSFLTLLTS